MDDLQVIRITAMLREPFERPSERPYVSPDRDIRVTRGGWRAGSWWCGGRSGEPVFLTDETCGTSVVEALSWLTGIGGPVWSLWRWPCVEAVAALPTWARQRRGCAGQADRTQRDGPQGGVGVPPSLRRPCRGRRHRSPRSSELCRAPAVPVRVVVSTNAPSRAKAGEARNPRLSRPASIAPNTVRRDADALTPAIAQPPALPDAGPGGRATGTRPPKAFQSGLVDRGQASPAKRSAHRRCEIGASWATRCL